MGKHRKAALLAILIGVCLIVFSAQTLLFAKQVFDEGNAAYRALKEKVAAVGKLGSQAPSDAKTRVQTIDFKALRAINEDAVAWLYSPGTPIDYPVVKARDYNYYLYHLLDHAYNANGTLFIDYNNAPDFRDRLTVIYGHHMASEMMFTSLMGYKKQDYYKEHPFMYLQTETEVYRVDLLYGCVVASGEWVNRAFMYEANLEELLTFAARNTTFTSDIAYQKGDRVVVFSTCSYEFNDARYVVLGVLKKLP